jgi:TonB-dependent receptor
MLVGVVFSFLFSRVPGHAQISTSGTIVGSVINQTTQKVLERATVTVLGTNLTTLTGADGTFSLMGVPAGAQRLQVAYAGLEDSITSVAVTSGGTSTVNVALKGNVVQLSEFKVAAEREGTAYAVQQQKNAESLRTVVSADAFGIIADANPGEFLKLMPGIQMDYTGVEPRGIFIRGMEPNLNQVMINGNQAAAAASSSTNRNFEFDQTTIDNIESIEVYKAPLPSMPANAIGGAVNLVTRSAFLQKGRRINATLNVTANSDAFTLSRTAGPIDKPTRKIHPGGSFMFSDSFLNNRLGVVLSVSNVNVNGFGGTAYDTYTYLAPLPAGAFTKASPNAYVNQYRREDHQNFTRRTGGSLNLDYKVNETTTAFLRTTLTDHYYEFRNRFLVLNTGTAVASGATPQRVEALPTTGNAQQNMSFGDKSSASWTFNPGMKHRFGAWKIDYDGSFSRANNHYEYFPRMFGGVTLTIPNVGFILEKSEDTSRGRVTQTSGPDIYNLANYRPSGAVFTTSDRIADDRVLSGKGSVRRDFVATYPFYVEVGGSYQKEERKRNQPNRRWTYAGPDGVVGTADDTTAANMAQFAERDYTPKIWFGERGPDAWISPFQLARFAAQAPQAFIHDEPFAYEQWFTNDRRIEETITAGYAMGNVKFGAVDVLVGARVERTEVDGEGARRQDALVPAGVNPNSLAGMIAKYQRTHASTSYTPKPFKYTHITWHATRQLQARASYTEAIGRPNFGSILPAVTVDDTNRTVSVNNTELLPQRAKNYDLTLEWYPRGTSSFNVSWFRKDIKDYINNSSSTISAAMPELDIGSQLVGYTLNTSSNLGKVNIEGFEFGGRYQLAFLPRGLNSLELFGNYTHLYKTEGTFVAGAASTVYDQLPNNAPTFWNLGCNYRTPDGKLFLVLRANFVDDIPRNITGRPQEQTDKRLVYDGEIRYTFTPRYTLSLAGRNITEAREGGSQIGRSIRSGTGGGAALTMTLGARF